MTHEDATAYAKARAYDGHTAYVMRKIGPAYGGQPVDTGRYTHVVSDASRALFEEAGWEVVEMYPAVKKGTRVGEVVEAADHLHL